MALVDIKDKIIYFVVNGQDNIPIHPIRIANIRSKKISKRTPSTTSQNRENGPANTKIRDKLKIINMYEIDGWIEPILAEDVDVSYFPNVKTAAQIRDEFVKYVFNDEAGFVMRHEGETVYGSVEKFDITEDSMDKNTTTAPIYSIKFIFICTINTITI